MRNFNQFCFQFLLDKMPINLNMFSSIMMDRIMGNITRCLIITI